MVFTSISQWLSHPTSFPRSISCSSSSRWHLPEQTQHFSFGSHSLIHILLNFSLKFQNLFFLYLACGQFACWLADLVISNSIGHFVEWRHDENRWMTQNLYFNLYWHEFTFATLQLKIFTVYSIGRLPVSGSLAERKKSVEGAVDWVHWNSTKTFM